MPTKQSEQPAGASEQPQPASEPQPQPASEQPQPASERKPRAQRKPRQQPQPQPQPAALDIAAAVEAEEIEKAQRVYVRIAGPFAQEDGTLAAVDREKRADGTLGEYLLAEIRISKQDKSESAQRISVARVQALKVTLEAHGLRVFK